MVVPRPLIAVVDDDVAFTMLVQDFLDGEGYATLLIHEAEGALRHIAEAHPALVILDVRMEQPDSGGEILAQIRASNETSALPVIICSADQVFLREHRGDLERHRALILPKPFDLDDLLGLVRTCVRASMTHDDHKCNGYGTDS
jgi:DNA-binding response OmpR family regulator